MDSPSLFAAGNEIIVGSSPVLFYGTRSAALFFLRQKIFQTSIPEKRREEKEMTQKRLFIFLSKIPANKNK